MPLCSGIILSSFAFVSVSTHFDGNADSQFFFPRFDIVLATSPTIMGPQGEGDWRSLAKVAFGMGPSTLSALSLRILPEND
jgi:hypothetical protein